MIKNSWSFMSFLKEHGGRLSIGQMTNEESGDSWKVLAIHDGKRNESGKLINGSTLVNFSSNLGELTPQTLRELKDNLQVVEIEVSQELAEKRRQGGKQVESYKLCRNNATWQDVEL